MILIVEFGFPRSSGRRAGVGLVAPQARIDASRSASRRFAVLRLIPAFVLRWPAVTGDTPQWSPFCLLLIAAGLLVCELRNSSSLRTVRLLMLLLFIHIKDCTS